MPGLSSESGKVGVFGTFGRKVRLRILALRQGENSVHGCFADT